MPELEIELESGSTVLVGVDTPALEVAPSTPELVVELDVVAGGGGGGGGGGVSLSPTTWNLAHEFPSTGSGLFVQTPVSNIVDRSFPLSPTLLAAGAGFSPDPPDTNARLWVEFLNEDYQLIQVVGAFYADLPWGDYGISGAIVQSSAYTDAGVAAPTPSSFPAGFGPSFSVFSRPAPSYSAPSRQRVALPLLAQQFTFDPATKAFLAPLFGAPIGTPGIPVRTTIDVAAQVFDVYGTPPATEDVVISGTVSVTILPTGQGANAPTFGT